MAGNDHPLKIWREYRQVIQELLGTTAGVGKSYISQIESGSKSGSAKVLKALAEVLQVDVDDLMAGYNLIMDRHNEYQLSTTILS